MPSTTSPYMGLIIPTVSQQPGPDYANNINNDLSTIDAHDHSSGSGVPITPSGINLSSDLPFLGNNATGLRSIRLNSQSAVLSGASDINCLASILGNLYYNDGSGNQVQITNAGSIVGTNGSIANLTAPASASFLSISGKFVWQSGVNTAADMDGGSVIIREKVANAKGITLTSPTSLAADYALTFPGTLPASQKFATMDSSGNIAAPWAADALTLEIASGTTLQVKDLGITTAKLANAAVTATQIAANAVTTAAILDANVTSAKIATSVDLAGNPTMHGGFVIPSGNANNSEQLTITRGAVSSTGSVSRGQGYSVSRPGAGTYNITFTTTQASVPVVTLTPADTSSNIFFRVSSVSTTGFTASFVFANTGGLIDVNFHFICIGTR